MKTIEERLIARFCRAVIGFMKDAELVQPGEYIILKTLLEGKPLDKIKKASKSSKPDDDFANHLEHIVLTKCHAIKWYIKETESKLNKLNKEEASKRYKLREKNLRLTEEVAECKVRLKENKADIAALKERLKKMAEIDQKNRALETELSFINMSSSGKRE